MQLGLPESILVLLAAIVMAWEQALKGAPKVTAKHPGLRLPGWAHFVPLVLVVAGLGIFAVRQITQGSSVPPERIETTEPTASAADLRARADRYSSMQWPVEIEGIPTASLLGYFRNHTALEAERLVRPFIGANVQVRGRVISVHGEVGSRSLWLGDEDSPPRVALRLSGQDTIAQRTSLGQSINARCRLAAIDPVFVTLERCTF